MICPQCVIPLTVEYYRVPRGLYIINFARLSYGICGKCEQSWYWIKLHPEGVFPFGGVRLRKVDPGFADGIIEIFDVAISKTGDYELWDAVQLYKAKLLEGLVAQVHNDIRIWHGV